MLRVGITGESGFIGNHLFHYLGLFPDTFERVSFEKTFFDSEAQLIAFVERCDAIVHIAAVNRNTDPQVVYQTNLLLTAKLIDALEKTGSKAHVVFTSSTQENNGSAYGQAKQEAREKLISWSQSSGGKFTGLIIPNVFGPFSKPFYNTVVATFCHQLVAGQVPVVEKNADLQLIYVGELVKELATILSEGKVAERLEIMPTAQANVQQVLELLVSFKQLYLDKGIIPFLSSRFELNLFNTFRSFIDLQAKFPVLFDTHSDERGMFAEVARLNNTGGQVSFSITLPGKTRGNHFHTRKVERFAVIKGEARIELRKIGTTKVFSFCLTGSQPAYVDMPIWYTHNITNIGNDELYTVFWINESYDGNDPDTYYEVV